MKNRSLAIFTTLLSGLTCFGLLPQMRAAPDALPPPPPDGCYPGFTTAEGCNALHSLTTGAGNTGLGWDSLSSNTNGSYNDRAPASGLYSSAGNVSTDGQPEYACARETGSIADRAITTIEGLGTPDNLHPLQRAFMDEVGAQCGICTPGMVLTALTLGHHPSLAKIRQGLAGNLCRCTGYEAIYRAIHRAS